MNNKHRKLKSATNTIALNKKAKFDYFIEQSYEAGLSLAGWEVKSLREGRVQLKESYVAIKHNEAWLLGAHLAPLPSASTHIQPEALRPRKLLLHRKQLNQLIGATERRGYTLVPIALYWIKNRAKLKVGLGKGKKQHDKRAAIKEKHWQREQSRILKNQSR